MTTNKKILFLIIICASIALVGFVAWRLTTTTTTTTTIRTVNVYWPGMYWVDIANEKGWFQEAGLTVETTDANTDYFGSLQKTADGEFHTNNFSLFDLMSFNAKGADLVMVVYTDMSFGADGIVARPGIKSMLDLKGKKVGVADGTYADYMLEIMLHRFGLEETDIKEVHVVPEKASEVLTDGEVDAVVTYEPYLTEAVEKTKGTKLTDTSKFSGLLPNGYVFSRQYIEAHQQEVQAFVDVWWKTTKFIKNNPDEAFDIIVSRYGKSVADVASFTELTPIMELRDNKTWFTYGLGLESLHGSARLINEHLMEQGLLQQPLESTEFLDARFIRALKQ